MVDNVRKITDLTGKLFEDGQSANAITPQDMRDLIETMKTQYLWAYLASGPFTIANSDTEYTLTNADTFVSNGFSSSGAGVYTYNSPPVDSVSGNNKARSFLATAIIHGFTGSTADIMSFSFAVDGSLVTGLTSRGFVGSATLPAVFAVTGIIKDLKNGELVTLKINNTISSSDFTVTKGSVILMGLND